MESKDPEWGHAYAQDYVHPHILRMLEETFSLGVAHISCYVPFLW